MFYSQSSFPWSPVQRCSWKTENIQVDHETGQHLNIRQALGQRAAGSLLQLQGTLSLFSSLSLSSALIWSLSLTCFTSSIHNKLRLNGRFRQGLFIYSAHPSYHSVTSQTKQNGNKTFPPNPFLLVLKVFSHHKMVPSSLLTLLSYLHFFPLRTRED